MTAAATGIGEVLAFWFEQAGPAKWFDGGPEFDVLVRRRLLPLYERAAAGTLDSWTGTPDGALALLILLDQAPRNMFRGTPGMYATDAQAVAVAWAMVETGQDLELPEDRRVFVYLPFEHSESPDHQHLCVRLVAERTAGGPFLDYARRHAEVIRRFGRFPHRNAILGRASTAEELAFLEEAGSSF
jgi:uncharacterized protein (DUF924 family)